MAIEVSVPKFAEGATIIRLRRWLCAKDSKVSIGAQLAEAATDKIAIYIEAPCSGYISALLVSEGEQVRVGQIIALMAAESTER